LQNWRAHLARRSEVIWSTDISAHWVALDFLDCQFYGRVKANIVSLVCRGDRIG
jgi:uncharacterized membrane protein